jgi:uncharacterized protein GlcG (DUF336 family)
MISRITRLIVGTAAVFAATQQASPAAPLLLATDVNIIVGHALAGARAMGVTSGFIAVSDREGYMLGLYSIAGGAPAGTNFGPVNAIDKAGTAAYLSSNGEAFTSRTAGFIIQPHFPPGIINTGTGPLTGVGLSSLPFSDVNHFRTPGTPAVQATPILNTSLSGNPGGVPIYKNGVLVGGVGIDTNTILSALVYVGGASVDENIAVIAQTGYAPPSGILATQVLINGLRLPYTVFNGSASSTITPDPTHYLSPLNFAAASAPMDSPGIFYNQNFAITPTNPFPDIPNGQVRNNIIASPVRATSTINGQLRLSAAEVATILHQGAIRSQETRGAIRSPIGPAEVFIVVVDYYNPTGNPPGTVAAPGPVPPTVVPEVLGAYRTNDATIFSYDVAAQKARTALFFSNNSMALSSRGVGFLAQGTYPPGIDGTAVGPYGPPTYGPSNSNFGVAGVPLFPLPYGIQTAVSILPFGGIGATPINPYLPNGITVFPGGFPLYRNGVLIGAVGVSGDGVDQDDIISASATVGFEAPISIRSDQYSFRGARLPYAKFPQNSSL